MEGPKIVQISACGHDNVSTTQSNLTLFVLYDNGRVWAMNGANGSWSELMLPNLDDTREAYVENIKGQF